MITNETIEVRMSPEDVKIALAMYVTAHKGEGWKDAKPDDVDLKVIACLEGYGQGEHNVIRFDGAIIKITK